MCLFLVGAGSAQAAPLTDETLKTMLENLGYTVEEGGTKDAKTLKFKESLADNSLTFTITMDFLVRQDYGLDVYGALLRSRGQDGT
jgi:hypothetical protein